MSDQDNKNPQESKIEPQTKESKYLKKYYNLSDWQNIYVNQISANRSFIALLATACLGFTVSLLLGDRPLPHGLSILFQIICVMYLITIGLSLWIGYLVSENYRVKYRISRSVARKGETEISKSDVKEDEATTTKLEDRVRNLQRIQIEIFLFATALELFALAIQVNSCANYSCGCSCC